MSPTKLDQLADTLASTLATIAMRNPQEMSWMQQARAIIAELEQYGLAITETKSSTNPTPKFL